MPRSADVTFRGHIVEVIIDHDSGYDRDTGSHEIEWHFADLDADGHDALGITDDEEESIFGQLASLEPETFGDEVI